MKKLLIILVGISFVTASCEHKVQKPAGATVQKANSTFPKIEIFQVYGESEPVGYANDASAITRNFGFVIEKVAGSVVTDSLLKAVHENNLQAKKNMKAEYGKDWMKNFEKRSGLKLNLPNS